MKYISADDLEIWNNEAKQHRDELRSFYYSNARKRKFIGRLCSNEKRSMCKQSQNTSKKLLLVMFVGDRGLCIGSKIKGFLKYGGNWKLNKNSFYTTVCITNEHNTSQTCLFCFKKLLNSYRLATYSRDTVSATAIALAGLSTLLFSVPFPEFNPRKI
ncbi:hypothetical protein BCV71DRAFT_234551 [Rhizopus microsporus]|uniref:Uncharacterized protein n=1 Tax=Rhizopus microsporus TaxID=58291 RepID=A0A1X0S3I8_RHIZD|nr:hypothetical protein BCV71DRAFT_234551 [Rhizopus microsporus]